MRNLLVGLFVAAVTSVVACAEADPYGEMPDSPESKAAATACKAGGGGAIAGQDPSKMPACKGTKGTSGRCVDTAGLGSFGDTFEKANCKSGQACLPEDLIKQGSKIELTTCTAVLGGEGRCFWPLAKDIVANYDMLKGATKDQCKNGMVCAPCVNPLNKQGTGVCSLGGGSSSSSCSASASASANGGAAGGTCPQVEPIVDTKTFAAEDCGSNMLCVDAGLVPADQAKILKKCSKGVCAPKKSVERGGNYVPKTCRSIGDAEGRCTNVSIPQIGEQAATLPQADCDADERCAPCFDPRSSQDTGACHQASCDAPKEAAKSFPSCCGGRARCVPPAQAGDSADMLTTETCTGGALCAPVELVGIPNQQVKKCQTVFGLVDGICVSKCAISFAGADLVQGNCNDDEMCAPCMMLPDGTTACQ